MVKQNIIAYDYKETAPANTIFYPLLEQYPLLVSSGHGAHIIQIKICLCYDVISFYSQTPQVQLKTLQTKWKIQHSFSNTSGG